MSITDTKNMKSWNGEDIQPSAASDRYLAGQPAGTLATFDEGIEKLKSIVAVGLHFGCAVIQRQLGWGYNRSFHLMEHAVSSGHAYWHTETRIIFK